MMVGWARREEEELAEEFLCNDALLCVLDLPSLRHTCALLAPYHSACRARPLAVTHRMLRSYTCTSLALLASYHAAWLACLRAFTNHMLRSYTSHLIAPLCVSIALVGVLLTS